MNWQNVLKNVAPTLSMLLPPPFNAAAALAVKTALGLDKDASDDEVSEAALSASPEAILKLKAAEQQFELQIKQLELEREKLRVEGEGRVAEIEAKDRDSARDLSKNTKSKIPAVLATCVTIGFFGVLIFILMHGLPAQGGEALLILLGALAAAWTQILNYYFGSSSGSSAKTELLARATNSRG